MHAQWTQGWWVWAIRGVVAVFFGVVALVYPAPSLALALLLFGAYLQLDGLAALALVTSWGLRVRAAWPCAAVGLIGLLGGMLIVLWPDLGGRWLVRFLGACCALRGAIDGLHAARFWNTVPQVWRFVVSGIFTLGFGALLLARPNLSPAMLVFAFAGFVLITGVWLIVAALRLRALEPDVLTDTQTRWSS